jgi:hypothetical protein
LSSTGIVQRERKKKKSRSAVHPGMHRGIVLELCRYCFKKSFAETAILNTIPKFEVMGSDMTMKEFI